LLVLGSASIAEGAIRYSIAAMLLAHRWAAMQLAWAARTCKADLSTGARRD
jgi:hypothetical protein